MKKNVKLWALLTEQCSVMAEHQQCKTINSECEVQRYQGCEISKSMEQWEGWDIFNSSSLPTNWLFKWSSPYIGDTIHTFSKVVKINEVFPITDTSQNYEWNYIFMIGKVKFCIHWLKCWCSICTQEEPKQLIIWWLVEHLREYFYRLRIGNIRWVIDGRALLSEAMEHQKIKKKHNWKLLCEYCTVMLLGF